MQRSRPERESDEDEIKPLLQLPVTWSRTGDILHPFTAQVDGQTWTIRIGEFPEEPLYTLRVDDVAVGSFSTWPETWHRPRFE